MLVQRNLQIRALDLCDADTFLPFLLFSPLLSSRLPLSSLSVVGLDQEGPAASQNTKIVPDSGHEPAFTRPYVGGRPGNMHRPPVIL
jgi:hypothetical protein